MKPLILQLLAFSIFIINHIVNLYLSVETFTTTRIIAFSVLFLVFLLIFAGDYFFNFKRKGTFKLSVITYSGLTIAMWFINGFYWIAAFNILLFIVFLRIENRLQLEEK